MTCERSDENSGHTVMDVSVVIVTWNGWKYTKECLESLGRQEAELKMEVIVVDNGSSDGTPSLIRECFPHVRVVQNENNEGFAKANNTGIRLCKGNYVCLINSDVRVLSNCLAAVIQRMEQDPSIGIAGPKMLGPDGRTRRSCMRFPTLWSTFCRAVALDAIFRESRLFGGYLMNDFKHDRLMVVEVLNGWFWVVRRKALEEVGLLDEQFFIYGEDMDWCSRFRKAGWRALFYPEAEAIHYGGSSSATAPTRFYVEMQIANAQYWRKHHSRPGQWVYFFLVWLHELVRTLGYAGACLVAKSSRASSKLKLRSSLACLFWLIGVRMFQEGVAK